MGIRQKLQTHKRRLPKLVPHILFCLTLLLVQFPVGIFASEPDNLNFGQPLYLNWRYKTKHDYKIASDNAKELFLVNSQNTLEEISTSDGQKIWESAVGGETIGNFFVYGDNIIQLIEVKKPKEIRTDEKKRQSQETDSEIENYIVRSTDKLTGITQWQSKLETTELTGEIFCQIIGGQFIIVTTVGNLITISIKDGTVQERRDLSGQFNKGSFFMFPNFYVTVENNQIKFNSTSNSFVNFELKVNSPPTSLLISKEILFWGDKRGFINALSLPSNALSFKWRSRKGGEILSISKTLDGILAASADNYLYLISERNGDLTWKRRLASRTAYPPLVLGSYIIVLSVGESDALILDLETGKTVNRIILAENQFYTAEPLLLDKTIIFQTSEGLFAYSNVPSSKVE